MEALKELADSVTHMEIWSGNIAYMKCMLFCDAYTYAILDYTHQILLPAQQVWRYRDKATGAPYIMSAAPTRCRGHHAVLTMDRPMSRKTWYSNPV